MEDLFRLYANVKCNSGWCGHGHQLH